MDDILRAALAPVLRDLEDADIAPPTFGVEDWTGDPQASSAMLWGADGSGTGVSVSRSDSEVERVVAATDQVQEWAIEELWNHASTSWPECARHPNGHPLKPTVRGGQAWWICPTDHTPISEVGSLGRSQA